MFAKFATNFPHLHINVIKGYSLTTSVSIRRFPGLGEDMVTPQYATLCLYVCLYLPKQQQIWRMSTNILVTYLSRATVTPPTK